MNDLAAFLLARIAEDEAIARAADPGPWSGDTSVKGDCVVFDSNGRWVTNIGGRQTFVNAVAFDQSAPNTAHIARHDPARVLAECEAKRRIVRNAQSWAGSGSEEQSRDTLRLLALPYADHPDYDETWRP